jgi:hypothetical protein
VFLDRLYRYPQNSRAGNWHFHVLRKPWQLRLPGEEARYAQALAVIAGARSPARRPILACELRHRFVESLVRTRLAAGAEWIRTFSSAIPRHGRQRGRRHSAVCGGSSSRRKGSIGLLRPTTARMIPAPTVDRPNSDETSKPLPISRGTHSSNPFRSKVNRRGNGTPVNPIFRHRACFLRI